MNDKNVSKHFTEKIQAQVNQYGTFDIGALTEDSDYAELKEIPWYITEDVQNNLPAWKENITLPIESIEHIIMRHTRNGRVKAQIEEYMIQYGIKGKFSLDDKAFAVMKRSILQKIENRASFNTKEAEIVDYIVSRDKRDIFPIQMSDQQIQKAIRTAYEDARKISKRQFLTRKDVINGSGKSGGAILYQGLAVDIVIHFWFNFDNNEITTAYPIFNDPGSIRKDKLPKKK